MRKRPAGATLYDFRDLDLMHRLRENTNGAGITSGEFADLLGFEAETGAQNVGMRLGWMRKWGMVAFDDRDRTWKLTRGGDRVVESHVKAPAFKVIENLPDESMIEAMAMVTSRFQRGDSMLATMLRREFVFGTHQEEVMSEQESLRNIESEHEVDTFNRRQLWADVANHLTIARESIEHAQASLEDLGQTYGVVDLGIVIARLQPAVELLQDESTYATQTSRA